MSANPHFVPVSEIKSDKISVTKILNDFLKSSHNIVMLTEDTVTHYKSPEACRRTFCTVIARHGLTNKIKTTVSLNKVYLSKVKEDS